MRDNPYRLSHDLHGIGFKTADSIATKLGIKFDDWSRIEAGIQFALQTATGNGHCALPEAELIESATDLLGVEQIRVEECLERIVKKDDVKRDEISSTPMVFPPQLMAAEKLVTDKVLSLASKRAEYPDIEIEKALTWCQEKLGTPCRWSNECSRISITGKSINHYGRTGRWQDNHSSQCPYDIKG